MISFGLIGYGGIAQSIISKLKDEDFRPNNIGILVRKSNKHKENNSFVNDISQLIKFRPRAIVECASHSALHEYGEEVLNFGIDLIVLSIGALANENLNNRLISAASNNRAKIIIPAGAVGAIDALSASRLAGLKKVLYRSRKPPIAWKGTPAEEVADLDNMKEAQIIFKGTAGQAALRFPKNTNSAAAVALAGLGFKKTEAELIADPNAHGNIHEIAVEAKSGCFVLSLTGYPSPANPKTSMLTANSVVRTLLSYINPVVI